MEKYGIGDLLSKYKQVATSVKVKKTKGGIQDPLTEERVNTATFLNIELGQVLGITKGWTQTQLYTLRQEVMLFKANPQALWWKKWKVLNKIYGQKNKKTIRRVGETGRGKKQREGQGVLF